MTYQEEINIVAVAIIQAQDFNLNENNEAFNVAINTLGYPKQHYTTNDLIESAFIESAFIRASKHN